MSNYLYQGASGRVLRKMAGVDYWEDQGTRGQITAQGMRQVRDASKASGWQSAIFVTDDKLSAEWREVGPNVNDRSVPLYYWQKRR